MISHSIKDGKSVISFFAELMLCGSIVLELRLTSVIIFAVMVIQQDYFAAFQELTMLDLESEELA